MATEFVGDNAETEGLVSVVMPVYNVERYLGDAIESVLVQTYPHLELILVDDGSPDSCGEICDEYAVRDDRVRVIHQTNGGLANARNNGARAATGEFLTFIDSDDLVYKDAYQRMVSSLVASGSDLVTGNVRRFDSRRSWQAWNQERSHLVDRQRTSLGEHPPLLFDTVAWNKMFRRTFWTTSGITFPEGKLYEDIVPMFEAYRVAESVDVLRGPVYRWRVRSERTSITQRRSDLKNLEDRLEMVAIVHRKLTSGFLGSRRNKELLDVLYLKLFEGDLWQYVPHVRGEEGQFDDVLVAGVRRYWKRAQARVKRHLPQARRVQYQALYEGRPELIPSIRQWYSEYGDELPLVYEGDRILLDTREVPSDWPRLSAVDRELATEARMRSRVLEVEWTDAGALRVTGWAFLPLRPQDDQKISLHLEREGSGRRVDIMATPTSSPDAAKTSRDLLRAYDQVGFEAELDADLLLSLVEEGTKAQHWDFVVGVSVGDIAQQSRLRADRRGGTVSAVTPRVLVDSVQVSPLAGPGEDFGLKFLRPRFIADSVALHGRVLTLEARLTRASDIDRSSDDRGVAHVLEPVLLRDVTALLERVGDDRVRASIEIPEIDSRGRHHWRFRLTLDAKDSPVAWGPDLDRIGPPDSPALTVRSSGRGWVVVNETADSLTVIDTRVTPDLTFTARVSASHDVGSIEMALAEVDEPNPTWFAASAAGLAHSIAIPLTRTDWYGSRRPVSPGSYILRARRVANGEALQVEVDTEVVAGLRVPYRTSLASVEMSRREGRHLAVKLAPPVPERDVGARASRLILEQFGPSSTVKPEDSVFLRTNMGYSANDSALYLQREIERRGLDLTVYWGVKHLGVAVPPGGVPVLDGTREGYEKLARSRIVVNNYGGIWNYPAHSHQTYLQTWHGTPFKAIGLGEVMHNNPTAADIERKHREGAEWDYLLSPNPYCSKLFPKEFCYEGEILELGMPRNDFAATATAADQSELRRRLGIEPGRKVLLYAPTFRETLRTGVVAAPFRGLDLARLLSILGDEWVVLQRGHSFNARAADRLTDTDQVIDVTDHPDIAELYVAADACVTDYSSVMFDFVVTGKPLYFFTPDLAEYIESRPVYFDLAEVAPSDLHDDQQSLAEDILAIDGYGERYGSRYEKFREAYVPWDDGAAAARVLEVLLSRL